MGWRVLDAMAGLSGESERFFFGRGLLLVERENRDDADREDVERDAMKGNAKEIECGEVDRVQTREVRLHYWIAGTGAGAMQKYPGGHECDSNYCQGRRPGVRVKEREKSKAIEEKGRGEQKRDRETGD